MKNKCGAMIERGEITAITDREYIVTSFSRAGIETPPLNALNDAEYDVGDHVYFFMFPDGDGRIISKA